MRAAQDALSDHQIGASTGWAGRMVIISYLHRMLQSSAKIERVFADGGGVSPFHICPHVPQKNIGWRQVFASMRTVLLDRHAWQCGTGFGASGEVIGQNVACISASNNAAS
jgi:hypothetical protein